MGKKTHEEYVQELKDKGIEVIPVEEYVTALKPIMHRCTKHNVEWVTRPNDVLRGKGCRECKKEKCREQRCKTTEQYIDEINDKGIQVLPLEEYVNAYTPILHRCLKHDREWNTTPQRVLSGAGCPICGREKYHASRCKTTEQYIEQLNELNIQVEPLEEYKDSKTPILHRCLIHNVEWLIAPSDVLNSTGCYMCRSEKIKAALSKTHEQYVEELSVKNSTVIPLEKYNGVDKPVLHLCLKHRRRIKQLYL